MNNEQEVFDGPVVAMCSHSGKLYVASRHSLYVLTDDAWSGKTKMTKVDVEMTKDKNGSQA